MSEEKELKKLMKEINEILDGVYFSKLKDGTNLMNKCIKIGEIKARREEREKVSNLFKQFKKCVWNGKCINLKECKHKDLCGDLSVSSNKVMTLLEYLEKGLNP